jgi:hypothetical protein
MQRQAESHRDLKHPQYELPWSISNVREPPRYGHANERCLVLLLALQGKEHKKLAYSDAAILPILALADSILISIKSMKDL